jgi:inactivated superfamily I helicase
MAYPDRSNATLLAVGKIHVALDTEFCSLAGAELIDYRSRAGVLLEGLDEWSYIIFGKSFAQKVVRLGLADRMGPVEEVVFDLGGFDNKSDIIRQALHAVAAETRNLAARVSTS